MTTLLRRLLTVPLYLGLFAFALATLPISLPLAALLDLLRNTRWAVARAILFFTWYLGCEAAGIAASFGLWWVRVLRRDVPPDRWVHWHFLLQCWWVRKLVDGATRIFDLHFEVEGADGLGPGPYLLFIRHVSTADTILVARLLSAERGLKFQHVMKRELRWDPCLDIVGTRMGMPFVDRQSTDSAREIASVVRLADDLGPGEGVLIYPEGTRFTEKKRERILAKLESSDHDLARRARELRHVLPPRIGGPIGLLQHRPGTDVIFCVHSGFEGVRSFNEFLRGALVGRTVRVAFWRVPGADVPTDREAQIDWIFGEWRRVDAWVGAHRDPDPRAS